MHIHRKIFATGFLILSAFFMSTAVAADYNYTNQAYTTEAAEYMKAAWIKSGRDPNAFTAAIEAWSVLGGSPSDFDAAANSQGGTFDPAAQVSAMKTAWEASGARPEDFIAAVNAATKMGYSPTEFINAATAGKGAWNPVDQQKTFSYTPEQTADMRAAWIAAGKDPNAFAAAVAAAGTLGIPVSKFKSSVTSPTFNPAADFDAMKKAWVDAGNDPTTFPDAARGASDLGLTPQEFSTLLNNGGTPQSLLQQLKDEWVAMGNDPNDFDAALQGALNSGKSAAQFLTDLQAQKEALINQYNNLNNELKNYGDLWDEVNNAINNSEEVDWADIARRMGLDPNLYTPTDLYNLLKYLSTYTGSWNDFEKHRLTLGWTTEQYMNWLLGKTTMPGYGTCYDQNACYSEFRDKIDEAIASGRSNNATPVDWGSEGFSSFDADKFLDSLRTQIPALIRLVFALCYTIGVVFCMIGISKFKQIGESKSSSSTSHTSMISALAYVITGTALIYLPSTLQVSNGTIFFMGGDSSLFSYSDSDVAGMTYDHLKDAVIDIVKLVGLIAFVRGWILLSKMGSQSHQGTLTKSIVHIVAGILAVNIITTWDVVRATFGFAW